MSYQTLILLSTDSDASLDRACECLRSAKAFQNTPITLTVDHVAVAAGGWGLRIRLVTGEDVLLESQELVQRYGSGRADLVFLASVNTRFEMESDPDPDMEHFDYYLLTVECLTDAFKGIAFECHTEKFL